MRAVRCRALRRQSAARGGDIPRAAFVSSSINDVARRAAALASVPPRLDGRLIAALSTEPAGENVRVRAGIACFAVTPAVKSRSHPAKGIFSQHKGDVDMKSIMAHAKRFVRDEEGATMVEYGLMVALIAIVCITAVTTIGNNLNKVFSDIAASL
jgi:pilus assembly protein Flp/PilA